MTTWPIGQCPIPTEDGQEVETRDRITQYNKHMNIQEQGIYASQQIQIFTDQLAQQKEQRNNT